MLTRIAAWWLFRQGYNFVPPDEAPAPKTKPARKMGLYESAMRAQIEMQRRMYSGQRWERTR